MLQILNSYKNALTIAIIVFLSAWILTLKTELKVAHADYKAIESALTAQSNIIEANRVDYERNLAEANQTKVVIQTQWKTRTEVIYQLAKDTNATDCNTTMHNLNHYVF